jgi:hypothetical protein
MFKRTHEAPVTLRLVERHELVTTDTSRVLRAIVVPADRLERGFQLQERIERTCK